MRRLTGGGAIWHHHELTYALVVAGRSSAGSAQHRTVSRSPREPSSRPCSKWGFQLAGAANLPGTVVWRPKTTLLCFTDPDPEDIVTKGVKIVGSAQRRRRGAVLQHGSFLLARSSRTPELFGVSDLADERAGHVDWSDRLVKRIVNALGLESRPADIPLKVAVTAAELEVSRYRNPAWLAFARFRQFVAVSSLQSSKEGITSSCILA